MNYRLLALVPLLFARLARAEEPPTTTPWRVVAEIDPLNYVLRSGWSATAFVRPGPLPHWRFGASMYAGDLPGFAIEDGWEARIEPGFALHVHYFLSREARGWFFGGLVSLNRWRYTLVDARRSIDVDETSVMPAIGYQWFPFGRGLVIKPWLGVGIPVYATREPSIGDETHDRAIPVAPFVTVHLGYEF